jgi:cytochrome c oxidase cbb3-type subunit 3/ubiquinol-cytochrome c reductase cytochrome c subunit
MMRALVAALLVLVASCDRLPGRPPASDRPLRPSQVLAFASLWAENCAGCHGDDRQPAAAVSLADPVYLELADDAALTRVTAEGVAGTAMPAFARRAGGTLTDAQITVLVAGMRAEWARPGTLAGFPVPPYAAPPGDARRGVQAYAQHCAGCHGATGTGGAKGGSIVDGAYLALVSDQGLRTTVLVGRPARGMPNWRGTPPAEPMTSADVADVVAWLAARRVAAPGQPYPSTPGGL